MFTTPEFNRRKFFTRVSQAVGAAVAFPGASLLANTSQKSWTVGDIMDLFTKAVPGAPLSQTVDTLKAGNREIRVTGIVTTMFPTIDVIRRAISLNANLIIVHEPTYYNHLDQTEWLSDDPVYQYKRKLLADNGIAVWRNHDYIHRLRPDGVLEGVVNQLGWASYRTSRRRMFEMPPTDLGSLIASVKQKLGIQTVRYVGDLTQSCQKVLLMPGAAAGEDQIGAIFRERPDVLICGEINEWEAAEYVRDARAKGDKLSLVVLGHVMSEEPGSQFLARWLRERVNGVEVTHVPAGEALKFV